MASPKRPARLSTPMRGSRRSPPRRRQSCRPSPTIPASWSMRSMARPASTARAGPARTRISTRRWRGSSGCCRSAARPRRTSAARISSPRSASPGPTIISKRSRRAPTARWSGRRAAPPASAMIRCSCRMVTRTFGEMTSIEKHGLPPLGLGLSHRARAFVKLAEICLERRRTKSLRRLCALAVLPVEMPLLRLQQPCPPRRDRRGPLRPRLCARDRNHGRARARPRGHLDLSRRRHAVADAAADRRRGSRCDRQALARRAGCRK